MSDVLIGLLLFLAALFVIAVVLKAIGRVFGFLFGKRTPKATTREPAALPAQPTDLPIAHQPKPPRFRPPALHHRPPVVLQVIAFPFRVILFPIRWSAVLILFPWSIALYNRLNPAAQRVRECEANMKIALAKQVNLTNSLLDIASHYANHETTTQLRISENMVRRTEMVGQVIRKADQALAFLSSTADAYPQLKAHQGYIKTMNELNTLETDTQIRRERYNAECRDFNSTVCQFPTVLLARCLGYGPFRYS